MTKEDLKYFQSMPLDIKVAMTKTRIREWITYFGTTGTYISFSGGKDSTVLLHLVRELYPDVEAVFVNTGLEYPEIQSFAKSFDNVTVLRPDMPFNKVISVYGYPFISKEISEVIYCVKKNRDNDKSAWAKRRLYGERTESDGSKSRYNCDKYAKLIDADFYLSNRCCKVMKKKPVHIFEKQTDKYPIMATMAAESMIRESEWMKKGCNAFETDRPRSAPMSFWTENDVLQYIKENNLKIASVYGEIVPEDDQLTFDGCSENCRYKTTGCDRTGCIFCGYGAHLDKYSRFLRLKETHPKQYRYCMDGGEYDIDGLWKPNSKGLGMAHVIDELNKLYSKSGKAFIEY